MQNNIELRSEEVQEVLTQIPHWILRVGNAIILVIIVLTLVLSWLIKYPDIIAAEVVITTQIPPQKIIAKSSGRIEKIFITNTQAIKKNTVLAVIENTANYRDVFLLQNLTDSINVGSKFIFPFEKLRNLKLGEIEAAFAAFEKDYITYRLSMDLHPYMIEGMAQNNEIVLLKERLTLLIEQKEIGEREIQLRKTELERFKKLFDKGVIASQEWDTKNIEYLQAEKNFRYITSSISEVHSSINGLNKDSKNTKIKETKENVTLLKNTIQSYSQLKKVIKDWELNYVLHSSINGRVSFLRIWTENQTVTTGENIFAIIPNETDNYIGKVKAGVKNSGKIEKGQQVNIKLSNYPDKEFGILKGRIETIATTPDKDGNILIDISLPKKLETSYHKTINFKQEMSGTADIITNDLRLLERILYQFRDVFNKQ